MGAAPAPAGSPWGLRQLALLPACGALATALVLAWHHPLWPLPALLGCALCSGLSAWRQDLWLLALPVGAAALNFSPWTGWVAWDECDLLVLSTLGGAYARLGLHTKALAPDAARRSLPATVPQAPWPTGVRVLWAGMAAAALLGLLRGGLDAAAGSPGVSASASGQSFDWFAGYTDAANSLRVAKSELYALLLLPLWPRGPGGLRPLARGLLAGLAVVVCAALWERLAFPGLWNFDAPYRSVALFWEMHVGGEAIDGYLALATPFAVWAVLRAQRPWAWVAAAVLALLTLYTVLTTFSRGVYGATLCALTLLALLLLRQGPRLQGWRAWAGAALALLLLAEVGLVAVGGGFLWQRMAATPQDLGSRMQHWRRGLATLRTPSDWLLGLGPGRLPAHYAATGPAGELSGWLRWQADAQASGSGSGRHFARLGGPATRQSLGGQFALAQRTGLGAWGPHALRLTLRVQGATELMAQWCQRWLLYDGRCQTALLHVEPGHTPWQTRLLALPDGAPQSQAAAAAVAAGAAPWPVPRPTLFTLSVLNAGAVADIAQAQLLDAQGCTLLHNADFRQGLAHWQVAAQSYFLPWHIDSLVLELLIERGALGLLLFACLLGAALWRLTLGAARQSALAPYQAAALLGALCVGATGSLLDAPRVALLLYLLALDGVLCAPAPALNNQPHAKNQAPKTTPGQTGALAVTKGF